MKNLCQISFKGIKYFIFILLSVMLLASCTVDMDLNTDHIAPGLIVDGVITTDTAEQVIRLTKTADYFSNTAAATVSGAIVSVNDGYSEIILPESSYEKGVYKTPESYFGVVGRTYTLTISNIDINGDGVKEVYTASATIQPVPRIDQIHIDKELILNENIWDVKVWMADTQKFSNYYLSKIYKYGKCLTDTISEWGITNDRTFDGQYLNGATLMYFHPSFKNEKIRPEDVITIELSGISEDYYSFIREVKEEYRGYNPLFGGQPSNIRSNITKRSPVGSETIPRGYFAAYSISRCSTVFQN